MPITPDVLMPITPNEIYRLCLIEARRTDCSIMGFGCVAINADGTLLGIGHNARHQSLAKFCEDKCIRRSIPSRTQSMLGACRHAEENVIFELIRQGYVMKEVDLYIAGVRSDGEPYKKMNDEFTCLRCAVLMENAQVRSINVWNSTLLIWTKIKPFDAVQMAMGYALQQKEVDSK